MNQKFYHFFKLILKLKFIIVFKSLFPTISLKFNTMSISQQKNYFYYENHYIKYNNLGKTFYIIKEKNINEVSSSKYIIKIDKI